jgi:hypothetical protein
MLIKKYVIYNEIRLSLAKVLHEKVTLNYIENSGLSFEQKDYLIKSLIVALSQNDNVEIRSLIGSTLSNLLMPSTIIENGGMVGEAHKSEPREIMKLTLSSMICEV